MREIKFRVWCKDKNEWECDEVFINRFGHQFHTARLSPVKNDNHIIQQYTGQKDKNGKEIYEGDRVRGYDSFIAEVNGVVKYNGMSFVFEGNNADGSLWYYTVTSKVENNELFEVEVVGNIYENPD